MRYLYVVGSNTNTGYSAWGQDTPWLELAGVSLRSMGEHTDAILLANWHNLTDATQRFLQWKYNGPVIFRSLSDAEWVDRMAVCKVPDLAEIPCRDGDEVLMVDLDTYVQGDVFEAFDHRADVVYTSRPRAMPDYPINAGVWGLRVNPRTRRFLKWHKAQVESPTWEPLLAIERARGTIGRHDFWGDQDLLNACALTEWPYGIVARDVGPGYNWFPLDNDPDGLQQFITRRHDPHYKVLHFKGEHKKHLLDWRVEWARSVELEITLRCNLSCPTCNRHCNVYHGYEDTDMTMEQIDRFVSHIKGSHTPWRAVYVLGGEPTLHPEWVDILVKLHDELRVPGHIRQLAMTTNGRVDIPPEIRERDIRVSVTRHDQKQHYQTFVAPCDTQQERWPCPVLRNCGVSLSAFGYSPCGPGAAIARLCGFQQYFSATLPETPASFGDLEPICRMCQRAVRTPVMLDGNVQWSPTYAAALEKYKTDTPAFGRF